MALKYSESFWFIKQLLNFQKNTKGSYKKHTKKKLSSETSFINKFFPVLWGEKCLPSFSSSCEERRVAHEKAFSTSKLSIFPFFLPFFSFTFEARILHDFFLFLSRFFSFMTAFRRQKSDCRTNLW